MKSIDVIRRINNTLMLKDFNGFLYSINGTVLDMEFTSDIVETVSHFLNYPTDSFNFTLTHQSFKIEFSRNGLKGAVVCKVQPFGRFSNDICKPILSLIKNFKPSYRDKDLKYMLTLCYRSVQYAVLGLLKAAIKQNKHVSMWAKLIVEHSDQSPLSFAEFQQAFQHFDRKDQDMLKRFQKNNPQQALTRLMAVIEHLLALKALSYEGEDIPFMVNEYYRGREIQGRRCFFHLPNDLDGLLIKTPYCYNGLAHEHNQQLEYSRLAQAPELLNLSTEQFAFLEKMIFQQPHDDSNIQQRLERMQAEWQALKNSAQLSKTS